MMEEDYDLLPSKYHKFRCSKEKQIQDFMTLCEQKRITKEEFWKKTMQKKRQDLKERQNKLHKIDLEEEILGTELRNLKGEIRKLEASISSLNQEVSEMTVEKKRLEQEWQEKKETARKVYEALLAAMAYFKLKMKCYIDIDKEDSTEFIFSFFQDADKRKSSEERNYYVSLDFCGEEWKVLEMKPSITCEKEILLYLRQTKDIVSFISHVHNVYAELAKQHKF